MADLTVKPIAYIRTDFPEKFGIPRQSGRVGSLRGRIEFVPEYRSRAATRGIEQFSHLWLLFDFSESHRDEWSPTVRPPRLGGNKRVGVFASRSPFRPNPIGLSCVELISVEHTEDAGDVLIVGGADLLDMTPIIDIKPYLPYCDSKPEADGGYSDVFKEYRLGVVFPEELLERIPQDKRQALTDILSDDPRPSYQNDPERVYTLSFAGFDVSFKVREKSLTVTDVKKL